jgi:hypothetical protein
MIRITIEQQERTLTRRKAELGIDGMRYVAANSGSRRTEAKRALLGEIAWVRNLDGEPAIFVEFRGDNVEVSLGYEYRLIPRSLWRQLRPYWGPLGNAFAPRP